MSHVPKLALLALRDVHFSVVRSFHALVFTLVFTPHVRACRLAFKAIIDNLCPECSHGDLDFRIDGIGSSDGRWPLRWSIIPCPSAGLTVTRENGNPYYSKLKVEGGPSPVTGMTCDGMTGTRTSDAFYEFQHGGAFCGGGIECTVQFNDGGSDSLSVSQQELGGFC